MTQITGQVEFWLLRFRTWLSSKSRTITFSIDVEGDRVIFYFSANLLAERNESKEKSFLVKVWVTNCLDSFQSNKFHFFILSQVFRKPTIFFSCGRFSTKEVLFKKRRRKLISTENWRQEIEMFLPWSQIWISNKFGANLYCDGLPFALRFF